MSGQDKSVLNIRDAAIGDAKVIARIYNHYILNTTVTFEEQAITDTDMVQRISGVQGSGLPWLVVESDGEVVGYCVYRAAGLMVRRRKRTRMAGIERAARVLATGPNQSWSMDFVSDGFVDGRRLRCLNIVDDFTKECLAIEVDTSLPG